RYGSCTYGIELTGGNCPYLPGSWAGESAGGGYPEWVVTRRKNCIGYDGQHRRTSPIATNRCSCGNYHWRGGCQTCTVQIEAASGGCDSRMSEQVSNQLFPVFLQLNQLR